MQRSRNKSRAPNPPCHSECVSCFDLDRLSEPAISDLTSRYREAVPFAHVVLDDFVLVAPGDIEAAFPGPEWEHWVDRSSDHQPTKSSCRKVELMPPILRDMVHELSEPRFLRALIALSGFKNLLPDPYLHGGGLQRWGKGGEQIPHTDFPFHPTAPAVPAGERPRLPQPGLEGGRRRRAQLLRRGQRRSRRCRSPRSSAPA